MNKKIAFKFLNVMAYQIAFICILITFLFSLIPLSFSGWAINENILIKGFALYIVPFVVWTVFSTYRNKFLLILFILSLSVPVLGIKHFTGNDSKYNSTETIQTKVGYIIDDFSQHLAFVYLRTLEGLKRDALLKEEVDKVKKEPYKQGNYVVIENLTNDELEEIMLKVVTKRLKEYRTIKSLNTDQEIELVDKSITEYELIIKVINEYKEPQSNSQRSIKRIDARSYFRAMTELEESPRLVSLKKSSINILDKALEQYKLNGSLERVKPLQVK